MHHTHTYTYAHTTAAPFFSLILLCRALPPRSPLQFFLRLRLVFPRTTNLYLEFRYLFHDKTALSFSISTVVRITPRASRDESTHLLFNLRRVITKIELACRTCSTERLECLSFSLSLSLSLLRVFPLNKINVQLVNCYYRKHLMCVLSCR